MAEYWMTSGSRRLKQREKNGFAKRAETRAAFLANVQGDSKVPTATSFRDLPYHPVKPKFCGLRGSYSEWADPIARRAISVSIPADKPASHFLPTTQTLVNKVGSAGQRRTRDGQSIARMTVPTYHFCRDQQGDHRPMYVDDPHTHQIHSYQNRYQELTVQNRPVNKTPSRYINSALVPQDFPTKISCEASLSYPPYQQHFDTHWRLETPFEKRSRASMEENLGNYPRYQEAAFPTNNRSRASMEENLGNYPRYQEAAFPTNNGITRFQNIHYAPSQTRMIEMYDHCMTSKDVCQFEDQAPRNNISFPRPSATQYSQIPPLNGTNERPNIQWEGIGTNALFQIPDEQNGEGIDRFKPRHNHEPRSLSTVENFYDPLNQEGPFQPTGRGIERFKGHKWCNEDSSNVEMVASSQGFERFKRLPDQNETSHTDGDKFKKESVQALTEKVTITKGASLNEPEPQEAKDIPNCSLEGACTVTYQTFKADKSEHDGQKDTIVARVADPPQPLSLAIKENEAENERPISNDFTKMHIDAFDDEVSLCSVPCVRSPILDFPSTIRIFNEGIEVDTRGNPISPKALRSPLAPLNMNAKLSTPMSDMLSDLDFEGKTSIWGNFA